MIYNHYLKITAGVRCGATGTHRRAHRIQPRLAPFRLRRCPRRFLHQNPTKKLLTFKDWESFVAVKKKPHTDGKNMK